jgi:hypothetical protein
VAHAVEHAPHLALPSFVDRDLEPGVCLFFSDLLEFCRGRLAVIEINSLLEVVYLAVFENALYLGQIGLGEFMFWMGDQVRKIPVIRQDKHAFGVVVKPANGIDADLDAFQQVLDRGPALGVGHGRDKARGLVQHNVDLWLLRINELAIDLDMVFVRIGLGTELGHHLAVHAHPSLGDQFFRGAARRHARCGYDFLDTF